MTLQPRTPKGMRDFLPRDMIKRDYVFSVFKSVFESFGFEPISTPVMELQTTLFGNYGEDAEKLIFQAQHSGGGDELAMRYDLTVPLSRFFAQHENQLSLPFRRYHIAPVWRGERPGRGRYREFYQCDVDIVGVKGMSADAECLSIIYTALTRLGFGRFTVKINNRKLLTGIGVYAGVPDSLLGGLYRSIDKTDKIGLDGVAEDLRKNSIPDEVVQKMIALLSLLSADKNVYLGELRTHLQGIPIAEEGLTELEDLLRYVSALGVPDSHTALDLTMVRGISYYTGPIFEIAITEPEDLGSVGGGGRYDNLIGLFRSQSLPTTGTSFGIERLIDLMDQLNLYPPEVRGTVVEVLVTTFNETMLAESMRFASELRAGGIAAETYLDTRKGLGKQIGYADGKGIPLVAVLGEDEIKQGVVKLKRLADAKELTVQRGQAVEAAQHLLADL